MFGGIYRLYSYLFRQSSNEISWEIRGTDSPDKFPSQAIIDFLKFYIHAGVSTAKILSTTKPILVIKSCGYSSADPTILRFVTSAHTGISQGNNNIQFDFSGTGVEYWPNPNVCPENSIIANATL